ncbi:tRNA 5-hydroxyuridine modification protein YegQ [Ketobacter sp.]|uniref:prephenate-dependent tRNA uridine(34) hydroxylase TrhP n=1 Tax=Ketobacter sp. TaxID=2083498 RepID=UPI000F1DAE20|nr:tRNA 5-hydroxyuridine modification protein YegQ [Ketobacter sp.]RLU00546.1 MAG: U32 family peptidase [Ketobacter sp.]
MHKPELLSPAGSLKSMRYAFAYGADAIYAGQPRYSLRVRNNEFNKDENLAQAITEAHKLGKSFYLATNLAPHNDKIRSFVRDMEPIIAMGPDALIMSDPGLILLVREHWPDQAVHLSVQANAVNWASVKFWQQQGISRVILSRELSLDEIEEIRQRVPDMELEVFVHGALCIAYSGRCLLSGYMTHRDSNQGACTNSCRWKYTAQEARETAEGDVVAVHNYDPERPPRPRTTTQQDTVFLLQEEGRPGEWMPAFEDEHGTYIMNSKDLRAVQHIKRLTQMGIHSLKIEGRTKSHFYAARTAQIYRRAIEDAATQADFDWTLMEQLEGLAHRGYTEGFYRRHLPAEYQNYEQNTSRSGTQQFVGEVVELDRNSGLMTIQVKNRFSVGDELTLMTPRGDHPFRLTHMETTGGDAVATAKGDGWVVRIPAPGDVDPDFAMLIRHLAPT